MPVRIRCALTLWEHAGAHYAIPQEDSPAASTLRQWAVSVNAVRLIDRLRAGCLVDEHRVVGGVLVECRVRSRWVLIPQWCLHGIRDT